MKHKTINVLNLNAIIANHKADRVVATIRENRPSFLAKATIPTTVQLRRITLKTEAFDTPAGSPIYAFIKRISKRLRVLVDVKTGKAAVYSVLLIDSSAPVIGPFVIDGVIYDQKGSISGCPCYAACKTVRKPRKKAMDRRKNLAEAHDSSQQTADNM